MSLSLRARRDAATQEDVAQQWRDWCQYLRAQLRLLDARSASAQRSAFEHDESWEDAEATAQADLDAIPMVRRALFQAICAERRQIVQQEQEQAMHTNGSHRLLDPDAIDRSMLTVLLREAEGSQNTDGWGQVPCGTAEQPEWYRVDVAALNDAPSAALYALGQSVAVDRKRRLLLLGGLVSVSGLLLMLWAIWPAMPATAPLLDAPSVLVNGQPLTERWQPQTLILRTQTAALPSLPIVVAPTSHWPPESTADLASFWQTTTLLPLTLCVPGNMLSEAVEATVISAGNAPERRYQLREAAAHDPELRIESCGIETRPILVRYGMLQETQPLQDAPPGEAQSLQSGHLTLRSITVIGAGDDPTLPDGQVRVLVDMTINGDLALDWPALAPTLLLARGDALLPSDIQPTDQGVTLIYLAPAPTAPTEVVWMITAPQSQRPLRWRTSIAPPPGRAEILQRMLLLEQVSAIVDETDQIRISIQLRNRGDHPIVLTSTDIVVLHGAQVLSTPPIPDLTSPLAAGAARALTISLPHTVVYQPLTLTVGSQQVRLSLP